MIQNAIVRLPASTFPDGLTSSNLERPELAKALAQHQTYRQTLTDLGIFVSVLPADSRYPDSTFVEDVAVLAQDLAILTWPGAVSRQGEVSEIEPILKLHFPRLEHIQPPGTVEGGDVCEIDGHYFIGISQRTNKEGAQLLADILRQSGCTYDLIDIRGIKGLLHLKSGISALGDHTLVLVNGLAYQQAFVGYKKVNVHPAENYAANCIFINGKVIFPAGFPILQESLVGLGYSVIALEMSEFQKMDGGLSCLSLRY